jgi:uncharacterized repeat protein (TIGR01451 family)
LSRRLSFAVSLLLSASGLEAGDFRVNTPDGVIAGPSIAKGPAGDYLAVWGYIDVLARRFDANGIALGPDFRVNDPESGSVSHASTARFPTGGHVVAWSTIDGLFAQGGLDGGTPGITILPITYVCDAYYRELLADGSPAGPTVHLGLEEISGGWCFTGFPDTATQPDGSGVIVYQQEASVSTPREIHALRFPSQGSLPDLLSSDGSDPAVAAGPSGDLAIAWSGPYGPTMAVMLRLFAPDGMPQGPEFAAANTSYSGSAALAISLQGIIFLAWHESMASTGNDNSGLSVQARRFAPDGTPLGPAFQVNTLTAGNQFGPEVSALPDGGFLVAWQSEGSYGTDGSGYSVQARRYLLDGSPAGPEEQVNATEAGDQIRPDVAVDASGKPTFIWSSGDIEVRASDDRTDVGIAVTDGAATTEPGAILDYVVTVTNAGPADAPGAAVTTLFPPSLSCTWTCTGSAGAVCAPGPIPGDIHDVASIPAGGVATYDAVCVVAPDASGTLTVTSTVAAPAGLVDTNPANDTATDATDVVGVVIDDVTVDEGNAGMATAALAVRLLSPSATPVTVDFATGDGTATAGSDYLPVAGTLSFAPGETLKTVDVTVLGDTVFEVDETFFVTLSNAAGAPIVDGLAVGTILNDDSALPSGSRDELVHGSSEVRSLESAPGPMAIAQYWGIRQQPLSSYEVVVDGASGDLGPQGPALERVASDGTIVQRATGVGAARSLRWVSDVANAGERIRVQSRGCIDDCDAADVFRVRMWETTETLARFNNSATQVTVLLLQNTSDVPVSGTIHFLDAGGALLHSEPLVLTARETLGLNTSGLVPGISGSVRVASDAAYGALQGKAVAVEPATGFTFDTPLVPRPR